jgi:type II secretory pathway pseudopilin PulG
MVVVLIIAILLAIALVTFVGSQRRSNDRAAQSEIRNALTVEQIYRAGEDEFTQSFDTLAKIDGSLDYKTGSEDAEAEGDTPVPSVPGGVVYVDVYEDDDEQYLTIAAKSRTGTCFWLMLPPDSLPRFAKNTPCARPALGEYQTSWR